MSQPTPASTVDARSLPASAPSIGVELAVVALGGAIGASLRLLSSVAIAGALDAIRDASGLAHGALATLTVNLVGSLLLGVFYAGLQRHAPHPLLRPFVAVGVLGSFTTFSAVIGDFARIGQAAGWGIATGLGVSSLLLGIAAFLVGERIAGGPRQETVDGD